MERLLIRLYNFFENRRALFFVVFIASFLLAGFFASQVKFEEDISKILPKDKKIEKLNQVFQNSKFLDKLVITVSLRDKTVPAQPDSLVTFADTLVNKLQLNLSGYISKVNYKVDDGFTLDLMNTVTNHLPVFLEEIDYRSIDSLIQPGRIRETLQKNLRTLTSPAGIALKNIISKDPVGISFLGLKKLQQLQYDDNFALYDGYIVTKDLKHLMLFVTPAFPPNDTPKAMRRWASRSVRRAQGAARVGRRSVKMRRGQE